MEDGRQTHSKYMPLLASTNMCLSAIPIKNNLGVSHSDSRRLLLPPPTLPMIPLLLVFAAEITSLVVAGWGCPDNSYYVLSVLAEAVEAC